MILWNFVLQVVTEEKLGFFLLLLLMFVYVYVYYILDREES